MRIQPASCAGQSRRVFRRAAAGSEPADCPLDPMELPRTPPCRARHGCPALGSPGCPHRSRTQGCSVFQTPAICSSPLVCIPCTLQSSRSSFLSLPRAQREGVLGCPGSAAECG